MREPKFARRERGRPGKRLDKARFGTYYASAHAQATSGIGRQPNTIPRRPNMAILNEGEPAPNFTLQTDDGADVTLASLQDKPVVLFFYPKDDTPGCTIQ